jgi:hypothetical protein
MSRIGPSSKNLSIISKTSSAFFATFGVVFGKRLVSFKGRDEHGRPVGWESVRERWR